MIDVVVSGGTGRLGARIVTAIGLQDGLTAHCLGRADVAEDMIVAGRVLVVCAPKSAALAHVELAAAAGVPIVVATTGFEPAEQKRIDLAAERVAIIVAPNLSPGVTVLLDLVDKASRALPDYDLEIVEMHHNKKRDAPSGTAWALARAAAAARGQDIERDAILARAGDIGPRGKAEIGIQTLRGGDVIGEHTVMVVGRTERLELTHRAQSRDVFAAGAVAAVRFVSTRPAGSYTMRDVLGLG